MAISRQGWNKTATVRRLRAVIMLAAALGTSGALAEGARARKATPYVEARESFRRLGFQPYFMPGADICDPDDPRCFPELESCAKSRTFACTYTWRRGKAIVEVETRYDNPVVARSECIVNCSSLAPRRGARAPVRAVTARAGASRSE